MSKFNKDSLLLTSVMIKDMTKEPHTVWSLCCRRMNCEQGLKKALYTRAARKVPYTIETMFQLFVRMSTGVVPVGERLYWGKVPVGFAMEAKKGSEVCVCVCVCSKTHACGGLGEAVCLSDEWACA